MYRQSLLFFLWLSMIPFSFRTPLHRLKMVGYLEALSFVVLLLIAMPIKYLGGNPKPVQIIGMLHGVLFMLYVLALIHATTAYAWSMRIFLFGCVAAVIPFGPLVADAKLYPEQQVS